MTKIQSTENIKCWTEFGATETLLTEVELQNGIATLFYLLIFFDDIGIKFIAYFLNKKVAWPRTNHCWL
jgi:hypothetical protein